MKIYKVKIGENAELIAYIRHNDVGCVGSYSRKAMIVLPGGGYECLADHEAEPIALSFAAKGFQTFVLRYTVGENAVYPIPEIETMQAIAVVRAHAKEWFLDPDKICLVGFSAGGHLAASTSVHYNEPKLLRRAGLTEEQAKVNGLVLVYPCITSGEYQYRGISTVHGRGLSEREIEQLSCENFVGEHTPPTYLCHSADDTCVPVMNSLLFAQSLAKNNRPFEIKIISNGPHGMGNGHVSTLHDWIGDLKDNDYKEYVKHMKYRERFSSWLDESVQFLENCLDG